MTPQLAILIVAGFVFFLISLAGFLNRLAGPDPDLQRPWSPAAFRDDREPPCICGMRVPARRHRYHESSRWQERGERGL